MFAMLSPILYQAAEYILLKSSFDVDQMTEILELMDIWLDFGGKLNYSQIENYINLFYKTIENKNYEAGICKMIREMCISVSYIAPSNIAQLPQMLNKLLLICISSLCPNEQEIQDIVSHQQSVNLKKHGHKNPEQKSISPLPQQNEGISQVKITDGFAEGYETTLITDSTTEALNLVNRLIGIFQTEVIIPVLSSVVKNLLTNQKWTFQYAAIMALSQVGEHVSRADELIFLMHIIENQIKHHNYLIRCACFHSIGQYCDDKKYTFQARFTNKVIEYCLNGMQDPVSFIFQNKKIIFQIFEFPEGLAGILTQIGRQSQSLCLFMPHELS